MREFLIVLLGVISLVIVFQIVIITKDFIWNKRLNKFQKKQDIEVTKETLAFKTKRAFSLVLSFFLLLVITPLAFSYDKNEDLPFSFSQKIYVNAQPVNSKKRFNQIVEENSSRWITLPSGIGEEVTDSWSSVGDEDMGGSGKYAPPSIEGNDQERDYVDTNVQVKGVDEADIVKTDGNDIYYVPSYGNKLNVIEIKNDGEAILKEQIVYDDFLINELYLTDKHIILIGYYVEEYEYPFIDNSMLWIGRGMQKTYTASVKILDKNTYQSLYSLKTNGYLLDYRRIDNMLYLVSVVYHNSYEPRPHFEEEKGGIKKSSYLNYQDIYYCPSDEVYGMSVITSIDLDNDFQVKSKSFLGTTNIIYATKDSIYLSRTYYMYGNLGYAYYPSVKTQIIKFSINQTTKEFNYVASINVDGYLENSFWLDESDNYLRVVTTDNYTRKNRLYILKEDLLTDEFIIISMLTEGLGKPGETVKSVRFLGDVVNIVTFERTDPLYTIDISDPKNPVIIGAIEEPGFSTYLHPWGENRLIGLGFIADNNGVVTGMKISAYDTSQEDPLDTYLLTDQNEEGYTYAYSNALYNHKALLVDKDKGIFAFAIQGYRYFDHSYQYVCSYLIFKIDFDNPGNIIGKPLTVTHPSLGYYAPVERGIYINGIIYTLSTDFLVSADFQTFEIIQTLNLN